MTISEKKIVHLIKKLWRQKLISQFAKAFLNFFFAFACQISMVFLAIFLLAKGDILLIPEPFWLPELFFWMLFSSSSAYAAIQTTFSLSSLEDIARELDQKENFFGLFSTAYCFLRKKEKPVSAQLAIEQAAQKAQQNFSFWAIPCRRLWAILFLVCASFLVYHAKNSIKASSRLTQNPSKKNLLASKNQERKSVQPKEIPSSEKKEKKNVSKKSKKAGTQQKPVLSKKESPTFPGEKYEEKEMQSLFGEGEKWLAPGYLPSSGNNKQEKFLNLPSYHRFQHTIEDYTRQPSFPPEHRKAIQKYFSLIRQ